MQLFYNNLFMFNTINHSKGWRARGDGAAAADSSRRRFRDFRGGPWPSALRFLGGTSCPSTTGFVLGGSISMLSQSDTQ